MQFILLLSFVVLSGVSAFGAQLLVNGDFSGGLTGWTVENAGAGLGGQATVVSNLGLLLPAEAGQFALLETGPAETFGSPTPTYARLFQKFTLGEADTIDLSLRVTPVTARFTGIFASELDPFHVRILPQAGPAITLFSTDVSNPNFMVLPDAPASTGTSGYYFEYMATAIISEAIALGAGTHTLEFWVGADGNSFFDSGLLIEGVSIDGIPATVSETPEPSTCALLAGGLGVMFALHRRRRGTHV